MLHRHLIHQRYTLAAIDDVIARGRRHDWIEVLLSRFLRDHLLQVDAAVTMEFVQSIVESRDAAAYFSGIRHGQDEEVVNEFFGRIVQMQDVVRANAYSTDKMLVWSSTAKLIGRRFENNPELDEALAGHMATDSPSPVSGPRLRAHRGPAGMGTPFPAALGSHMINHYSGGGT